MEVTCLDPTDNLISQVTFHKW